MEAQVINSAHVLTMDKFIDCLVDKNYSVLIISGSIEEIELKKTFDNIYAEYCELTESDLYKFIVDTYQDMAYNNWRIVGVRASIAVLRYRYHELSIETLRHFGYKNELDPEKPEEYSKALDLIETKIKSAVIANSELQKQLNLRLKDSQDKQPSRTEFIDSMAVMGKYFNHHIDPSVITVAEYARHLKIMQDVALKQRDKSQT